MEFLDIATLHDLPGFFAYFYNKGRDFEKELAKSGNGLLFK
jgi:hypothetical protein